MRALLLLSLLSLAIVFSSFDPDELPSLTYQSILPESRPNWITANSGGVRSFGGAWIELPAGFTNQGGATVFANFVNVLGPQGLAPGILSGSELTVGIWPANDQTVFDRPITIGIFLNSAQSAGRENELEVRMYKPATQSWQPISTRFDSARYQLVFSLREVAPVSKDFPDWGGRTFFGIFPAQSLDSSPSEEVQVPAASPLATGPTVNRNSNLRAGPGINYAVVDTVPAGTLLALDGQNQIGTWLRLASGAWIAAFLVDNVPDLPVVALPASVKSTSTATPTVSPTPTPTPTPVPERKGFLDKLIEALLGGFISP